MAELGSTVKNAIKIKDVTGKVHTLYYRNPTTSERVQFERMAHQMKKNRFVNNGAQARLEFGAKIVTGFNDGDYTVDGRPISSDPASENYRADWKELLEAGAADHLSALGMAVFQGAQIEEDEENREEDGERVPPFGESSNG